MNALDALLAERAATHGDFTDHARATQRLKAALHSGAKWSQLSDVQTEALEMIVHKIGRVLSGDPNCEDHWRDIAGYATLAAERCDLPPAPRRIA